MLKKLMKLKKKQNMMLIAYINNISSYIGKSAKYFHYGVTSSDIIDTCFSIQLKQSSEILINQLEKLLISLKKKSEGL